LGSDAMAEIGEVSPTGTVKEVYWTVYPETENERNRGVFVCSYPEKGKGCNRLFVRDKESRKRARSRLNACREDCIETENLKKSC